MNLTLINFTNTLYSLKHLNVDAEVFLSDPDFSGDMKQIVTHDIPLTLGKITRELELIERYKVDDLLPHQENRSITQVAKSVELSLGKWNAAFEDRHRLVKIKNLLDNLQYYFEELDLYLDSY